MKQKMVTQLVLGALATLSFSVTFAGQIQSSSVSIAREVITSNDQAVNSPTVSYRFAGDVDATSQLQTFQVQFRINATYPNGGTNWVDDTGDITWATAGDSTSVRLTDGVTGAPVPRSQYDVLLTRLSTDSKIYATTIQVKSGFIKQPVVSISNSQTITATGAIGPDVLVGAKPTVKKLFNKVGAILPCENKQQVLPVAFKHFVALTDPTQVVGDGGTGTADEHTRSGATNGTTLITFPTNLSVTVAKATGTAKVDVTAGGRQFAVTSGAFDPAGVLTNAINAQTVRIGTVKLNQQAQGYDSALGGIYSLTPIALNSQGLRGNGINSSLQDGSVEVNNVKIEVTASQGFVAGGRLFLSAGVNCSVPIAPLTLTGANVQSQTTSLTADLLTAFGANGLIAANVCYDVPVTNTLPIPASNFDVNATIVKSKGSIITAEQDNSCTGSFYPLSAAIKIDVRNYADSSRTDGWLSVLRLINNSETRKATVYGQYILANGQYGKTGVLTTLEPRAVLNMLPADVAAKLTTAPSHVSNAALNNSNDMATGTANAPRLRITTDNGDTIRVQNYLYNPASNSFIEASGAQGVDFSAISDRAQDSTILNDQDAQLGINGK